MLYAIHSLIARLRLDKRGASAVEYAIMVGVIGAVLVVGARSFGISLSAAFTNMSTIIH